MRLASICLTLPLLLEVLEAIVNHCKQKVCDRKPEREPEKPEKALTRAAASKPEIDGEEICRTRETDTKTTAG